MFLHFFSFSGHPEENGTTSAISGLIITETVWGLFILLVIFREAVSAAPSRLCSIPPAAPKGWWLWIRVVSFRLTHPPAHKFTYPNTPYGHDPSGFFLHLWFPVSDKGAWAGELTNTHQPTYPDGRWTDRQRNTCTLCLSVLSGLAIISSLALTVLYKCPQVDISLSTHTHTCTRL